MTSLNVIGIRFKPVEALLIRPSGEFQLGTWLRGFSPILPSTPAGALANAGWCLDSNCSRGDRWVALRRCIASLLSHRLGVDVGYEDIVLRGPAVLVEGRGEVKPHVMCYEGLVEVMPEGISEWVDRQERGERPGKRAGPSKHRLVQPPMTERTGVGLDRVSKTVLEGYLYTVPYMDNYIRLGRNDFETLTLVTDVLVRSNARGGSDKEFLPIRLGGEGRKALLEMRWGNAHTLMGFLQKLWGDRGGGEALLLLATPMLLPELRGVRTLRDIENTIVETVKGGLKGCKSVKRNVFSIHPKVRVRIMPLQLGFDERKGVKGEMLPALMPGAVLRASIDDWKEIYWLGAGKLREVGFGTLLPLPYQH